MFFENEFRNCKSADLTESDVGRNVRVAGWVDTIRDHGGVVFVDLRDCGEILQIVFHDDTVLRGVCRETVVSVEGILRMRDEVNFNDKLFSIK